MLQNIGSLSLLTCGDVRVSLHGDLAARRMAKQLLGDPGVGTGVDKEARRSCGGGLGSDTKHSEDEVDDILEEVAAALEAERTK
jgi:hypothetical protein